MKKRIYYFDYASTAPLDKRVFKAMEPFFTESYGNPSNLDSMGRDAKKAVNAAAKKIVAALDCRPEEFVFTASATEADNLAVLGIAKANRRKGNKIIISNIEHKSILSACEALAKEGFEILNLKIGKNGLISPDDMKRALDKNTILVSVACADSETGTIQPIKKLARTIMEFRRTGGRDIPYFHTDASQAANFLDINANNLGVDLLTLSSPKIYGPKGMAGLYVRRGTNIQPLIYGGGQQGNLRSGTENVPGIVGFGEAMEMARKKKTSEAARLGKLRDKLEKGVTVKIDRVLINGNKQARLPNFSNISILDVEGEAMILYLDKEGIIANTGSACNSQTLEPSYVLSAFGLPYEYIHGSLRFTLGRQTTEKNIDYLLKKLPPLVKKLRKISPLKLNPAEPKALSLPRAFVGGQTPHFLRKKQSYEKTRYR